jgi:hypothetical protein
MKIIAFSFQHWFIWTLPYPKMTNPNIYIHTYNITSDIRKTNQWPYDSHIVLIQHQKQITTVGHPENDHIGFPKLFQLKSNISKKWPIQTYGIASYIRKMHEWPHNSHIVLIQYRVFLVRKCSCCKNKMTMMVTCSENHRFSSKHWFIWSLTYPK